MNRVFVLFIGVILLSSCSKPEASFVANLAEEGGSLSDIQFKNNSINQESVLWYFGDGTSSPEENPRHSYNLFGNIMVVLEARSGNSVDRDTQYINIPEPPRKKVKIETPFGDMVAELYNTTPRHRDNFLKLAGQSFYDDLLFHRVMDGFMIQGGDPDSRNASPEARLGIGGPGYTIEPEIRELHYFGSLASARKPTEMPSSGSQFYIVEGKQYSNIELANVGSQYGITFNEEQKKIYNEVGGTPFLDNQYTVFGRVIEGLEVIDKITKVDVNSANRPLEDIKMKVSVINE